jgi:hypothetical protein
MKQLASALIVRGLDLSPREADQKRKYVIKAIPSAAERRAAAGVDWEATGKSHDQLMLEAFEEVSAAQARGEDEPGPATVELAVRSVLPLIANNALVGTRGFDRTENTDERPPSLVIDAMRQTRRGVRQLGEVLREHAEGKKAFGAVDAAGEPVVGNEPGRAVTLSDAYLRAEFPDPGKVPVPTSSGDQPRDVYNQRVHDLQTVIERLDIAREQVKNCREYDGMALAERYGIDYRACRKWLDVIHAFAKDLAIWEQADIKYSGLRHDDEVDAEDLNPRTVDDSARGDHGDEESDHDSL